MLEGLTSGFDGVFVFGCHIGDCHYLEGNHYALRRVEVLRQLLDLAGIGADRLQLRWVSAAEGQIFADNVKDSSRVVEEMGPFAPEKFESELSIIRDAVGSPRLRWLMGMDRQLTQRENVFHEKLGEEKYRQLLTEIVQVEYQKGLIMEALRKGPLTVAEMSAATGMTVYEISIRLGELEKCGKADLHGYEGGTPRFLGVAA